jgi:MoxR-like ATPase
MVLATQNPIEMEGTYPLPEAQLDRFFFKSVILPPSREELHRILDLTTGEIPVPRAAATREDVLKLQEIIRILPIARQVQDYAVRIVAATHNPGGHELGRYIRYGASPRGAQSLVLGGKGFAFLAGRNAVSYEDIRRAALPALRHRLILSFEAEAEGIEPDTVISTLIGEIPE